MERLAEENGGAFAEVPREEKERLWEATKRSETGRSETKRSETGRGEVAGKR